MTMRKSVFTVLLLSSMIGCALNPLPSSEKVVTDALPSSTSIPSKWQAESNDGSVSDGWLASFNDPALDAIVAEALRNNPDLRIAAERVRISNQQVILVGSQMKPQIGAKLGDRSLYDDSNSSEVNSTMAYAGVAWELDIWGRIRAQRDASEANAKATLLDYAYARQSLAATVGKAWYLASEARQLVELGEQSVSIYTEQLRLSSIRRQAGKDSDLGVADTQAKLNQARADYENAVMIYGQAQRALEVLLGRYPAAEIEASLIAKNLPAPINSGDPQAILKRRPDLLAAEQNTFAAFRLEESANLALLPSFSFDFSGGRFSDSVLSLLNLNPWLATANVGMLVPIYEGGVLRANIQIANAKQIQSLARYAENILTAFKEVEDGLAADDLLQKQLQFENVALQDSILAVKIATVQYTAGRQDLMWVTTLQQNQIEVEAATIRLRSALLINRIYLNLALGRSFDDTPATTIYSAYPKPIAN